MEEEKPKKPLAQLDAAKFTLAEAEQERFMATIEPGTTRAEVCNPAFFAHIASKLRPYTEILLRCEDGTLYAKALVLQAERTWATVHILEWHDLTTKDVSLTQTQVKEIEKMVREGATEYSIEYKGPTLKHCVIRNGDQAIVADKIATKAGAHEWLANFLKVTA